MSEFSESRAKYQLQLLNDIYQNNSYFGYIPSDIGEIVYCDTTTLGATPPDPLVVKKKRFKTTLWSLGIIALLCFLLRNSLVWAIILSLVTLIVSIIIIIKASSFKGTDYLVGTDGFAVMKFDKQRDNIIEKNVYHFCDYSELLTGETYKKVNYTYQGTDYFFSFLDKPNEENQTDIIVEFTGTYHQEKPKDDILEEDYLFYREVEVAWSKYKFPSINEEITKNGSYTFNLVGADDNSSKLKLYPCIKITNNSIEISGRVYNHETLKRLYFSNGNLIIEHMNYSKKLLGLIEKGQKEEIPLTNVGNKKIFLMYLDMLTTKA